VKSIFPSGFNPQNAHLSRREKNRKNEGRKVGAIKYSPGWPGKWGLVNFRNCTSPGGGLAASWCFSESKLQNAQLRGDSHHARFQKNLRWRPSRCPINIPRPLLDCNRGVITTQNWPQNFHRPPGSSPSEICWNHAQSVTNSESQKKLSQRPNRRGTLNRERGGECYETR